MEDNAEYYKGIAPEIILKDIDKLTASIDPKMEMEDAIRYVAKKYDVRFSDIKETIYERKYIKEHLNRGKKRAHRSRERYLFPIVF